MSHKCFLIEPNGEVVQHVMVYIEGCRNGEYHRAEMAIRVEWKDPNADTRITLTDDDLKIVPQFLLCEKCGQQLSTENMSRGAAARWRRIDTGEVKNHIHEFSVGAMWRATWYKSEKNGLYGWDWDNATEPPLIVLTPGGDWNIDSRASNCTLPNERLHRCWVRHGAPPTITVDKNGSTCRAGGGSIMCGNYHGFLQNGFLT